MEIEKLNCAVRCDIGGCKNVAEYAIRGERTVKRNQINVCAACARGIYAELSKIYVPKSPDNILTKKKKASEENK